MMKAGRTDNPAAGGASTEFEEERLRPDENEDMAEQDVAMGMGRRRPIRTNVSGPAQG